MAAVAVDMEIPRNDNRLSLPGVVAVAENLALLPSPRYPSMPRFAATRQSHSDIDATEIRNATFKVEGMVCAACAGSVEKAVKRLPGIQDATVALLRNRVQVLYRPAFVEDTIICEAIEDAGFDASIIAEEGESSGIIIGRFRIEGMTSTSCSDSIEAALNQVPGVKRASVAMITEESEVEYDSRLVTHLQLMNVITNLGFKVELISAGEERNKVWLELQGLNSQSSIKLIKTSLEALPGVTTVDMDTDGSMVEVAYDPNKTGPRYFIQAIAQTGPPGLYTAKLSAPENGGGPDRSNEIKRYKKYFFWSCVFTVPVILLSMIFMYIPGTKQGLDKSVVNRLTVGALLRWILSTPVQFVIGRQFYVGAYRSLCNSAMLISFILLGKLLEVVAKGKTSEAISELMNLAPVTATLLTIDEQNNVLQEQEISSQLIQRKDIIKVVPGSKIPTDGVVQWGQSFVNESMITGEARPVPKKIGDKVIGGTMNENGVLHVSATHVGAETALSQIVRLVEAAQMAKARVQKFADLISKYFVPSVVVVSVLTWLGWYVGGKAGSYPKSWIPSSMDEFELALQFGISVLVVACPCALGLATPTAVMVATGKGASQGVLIKGGQALEGAHKVKTIVFDKTGTLTIGKPIVVNTKLYKNMALQVFYETIAAAEVNSEHPLAKAVMEYKTKLCSSHGQREDPLPEAKEFLNIPGQGVRSIVDGKEVLVGNQKLMVEYSIEIPEEVAEDLHETQMLARTGVLVAINREIVGEVAISDPVKPEAAAVIECLKSMGIRSMMVTGDNWDTAVTIARELGIERTSVYAESLPKDKANIIKEIQTTGITVAMVGDGINDSPALVAADVGMAIGAGTDIAIEAADIVLMKSNLEDVITAIDLSRKTFRRIRLNYVWALGYNVLGIPIAAGVLFPSTQFRLPPWVAGAAMAASSVNSFFVHSILLEVTTFDFCLLTPS
ncbi:unnamed protein product [Sphagnum compactum]